MLSFSLYVIILSVSLMFKVFIKLRRNFTNIDGGSAEPPSIFVIWPQNKRAASMKHALLIYFDPPHPCHMLYGPASARWPHFGEEGRNKWGNPTHEVWLWVWVGQTKSGKVLCFFLNIADVHLQSQALYFPTIWLTFLRCITLLNFQDLNNK